METPLINTEKFAKIVEDLLVLNQQYNHVFQESEFSKYCVSVLRKNFYDYIHTDKYTAICKVHIKQESHIAVCLDETHYVSNFALFKGQVAVLLRILPYLGYIVHRFDKRTIWTYDRKIDRIAYLKSNFVGVAINDSRKYEEENKSEFGINY